jgi:hypothetical protein
MSMRPDSAGFTSAEPDAGVGAGTEEGVDDGVVDATGEAGCPVDETAEVTPLQAEISAATAASSPVTGRSERLMRSSSSPLITKV